MTKKEWLWGPGRIDPEYKGLAKRACLERLASVRESYLAKLLRNLKPDDIQYICRLEKARFSLLLALDEVSDDEFRRPRGDARPCPGWSLGDIAAHLLTHEEKNVDPDVNETLRHMAEHEETHLGQVRTIIGELRRDGEMTRATTRTVP
jgi:hypothetical protein